MQSKSGMSIGVIGAGRLGTTLAWSLHHRGWPVTAVASRSQASAQRLANSVPLCQVLDLQAVVDGCQLVFVCTPDAAIAPVVDALRWRPGVAVVHCSGATGLDALAKALSQGAEVGGFHPLQSFAEPISALQGLMGCTITIEAEGPLGALLAHMAASLDCPVNVLPPGQRAAYHAAAAYASQFVHVLLAEAAQIWQQWGATEAQALHALLPLLRGTVASLERAGIAQGMPGPVSRGDRASVAAHLGALRRLDSQSGGDASGLYRALCLRSIPLALQRGGISAADAAAFEALLQGSSSDK